MTQIRVLVVEDHLLVHDSLEILFGKTSDICLAGVAADSESGLLAASECTPDVILLDLGLPDRDGLEIIAELLRRSPSSRVLVVTARDEASAVQRALAAGATGYLGKFAGLGTLVQAIRMVHRGKLYVNVSLNNTSTNLFRIDTSEPEPDQRHTVSQLSDREYEVLGYLARGYTNKQIAHELYLSVKSIETFRSRLQNKLELRTRADLTQFALQAGILDRGRTDKVARKH